MKNIMPNLQKLSFIDHDTNKVRDLDRNKYMKLLKETLNSPKYFVPMEWEKE